MRIQLKGGVWKNTEVHACLRACTHTRMALPARTPSHARTHARMHAPTAPPPRA